MLKQLSLATLFIGYLLFSAACGDNQQPNNSTSNSHNISAQTPLPKIDNSAVYSQKEIETYIAQGYEIYSEPIGERLKTSGFQQLKTKELGNNDVAVRVWDVPSFLPLSGFILERTDGKWKADYLPRISKNSKITTKTFSVPLKGTWEDFWKRLESLDILTIPYDMELGKPVVYTDGDSILIEVKQGQHYRFYIYAKEDLANEFNPAQRESHQKILKICAEISNEFNIRLCSVSPPK